MKKNAHMDMYEAIATEDGRNQARNVRLNFI